MKKRGLIRKILISFLCAVIIIGAFIGSGLVLSVRSARFDGSVYANEYEKDKDRAVRLSESYYRNYYFKGLKLLTYYPYRGTASCWEYIGLISLTYKMALLDSSYLKKMDGILDGLKHYRSEHNGVFSGYSAWRSIRKNSADYRELAYDDNMWLGRDFVGLYELTNDKKYLDLAVEIAEFLIRDAYVDLDSEMFTQKGLAAPDGAVGGFYWAYEKDAVHACSTGPAAQFFAALYRATSNKTYIDIAENTFRFLPYLLNEDGVFHDFMSFNKDADNNILSIKDITGPPYTYNSGSPITAAVELYKVTSTEKYLDYAKEWARSADEYFAEDTEPESVKRYPTMAWFNLILLNGYTALYPYDQENTEPYIINMQNAIDYGFEHSRLKGFLGFQKDFFSNDWYQGWPEKYPLSPIALQMSANAEIYATLAYWRF
ncbi:MAG: glycoside hydrolase family 76 protein [Clostridiales bacterium]|nr:glycoside hydrolase family 76 protein [Clostridiales bacterium]